MSVEEYVRNMGTVLSFHCLLYTIINSLHKVCCNNLTTIETLLKNLTITVVFSKSKSAETAMDAASKILRHNAIFNDFNANSFDSLGESD